MKKLIIGPFAAILMSTGLVAFSGSTATAAPYPGTVDTSAFTFVGNVDRGDSAEVRFRVNTDGNATPRGEVRIVVRRDNGGFFYRTSRFYSGDTVSALTPGLDKKGRYSVRVRFIARDGSVFEDSSDSDSFRVMAP